jgi:hypothetical protein
MLMSYWAICSDSKCKVCGKSEGKQKWRRKGTTVEVESLDIACQRMATQEWMALNPKSHSTIMGQRPKAESVGAWLSRENTFAGSGSIQNSFYGSLHIPTSGDHDDLPSNVPK